MESEIKLVDLTKENVSTVNDAIRLASGMTPTNFLFYVKKNLVRNGLVTTKIVPMSTEAPPTTGYLINYEGLKNLKKTLDFAKKILGDDGEVAVDEKSEPVVHAVEEAAEVTPEPVELEREPLDVEAEAEGLSEEVAEEAVDEAPKKKKGKKATALLAEEGE